MPPNGSDEPILNLLSPALPVRAPTVRTMKMTPGRRNKQRWGQTKMERRTKMKLVPERRTGRAAARNESGRLLLLQLLKLCVVLMLC